MPPATNSSQAFNNLQSYTQNMESPQTAVNNANQQYGVNAAQQQVQGLRGAIQNTTNLLQNVAPSIMGRTANSLVTSAQADRQIQNEQAPLNTQLNTENQNYQNANQDYQSAVTQAQNAANSYLQGQQNQQSYLQNLYNDLYSKEQNAAQQAEAQRQFNAQLAESRAARASAGSAGASPTFGGGGGQTVGAMTRDARGGFAIKGPGGNPITMGQYAAMNGLDIHWIAQQLMQGSPGDQKIAAAINSNKYTSQQLRQMFPQALGGSY